MIQKNLHMDWMPLVFFILGFQLVIFSQNSSELPNGVQGLWANNSSKKTSLNKWDAQWIWLQESMVGDVMFTRRTFDLATVPNKATIRITASSKYELYINEVYICQGPARSAPHHQSFDILEIQSLLKIGRNNISIRVHHQKGKFSYHLKGRAGLLAQLDFDATFGSVFTDKNWKVIADNSWDDASPIMNRFQMAVNDRVDLGKQLKGWQQINYDDSNWDDAFPLLRNSGWPSPKKDEIARALTTPWTSLIPRDIPYLMEKDIEATHLILEKEINIDKQSKHFEIDLEHKSIEKSQKNAKVIIYDFGKIINGMPKLNIEGPKGSIIDIYTAPYILNNTFKSNIVDSDFHDQLILSGQIDNWQSMYFKPARYLAIVMNGPQEHVKIHFTGIHQIKYPFELKGTISTPEAPWIEDLWNASTKTIDVCTTDAFTDNYRERRQYAQTGYYAALGNYFTFGDTALQRRYLIQIAQEQEANGIMPAYAPLASNDYMVILDSNCLWIRSLYNYLLFSGDYKTIKELLPAAKKLMTLLHSYTNDLGLLDNPPYAYWLDHTLNDRRGANTTLNGHYLGALKDFSQLLGWLEDEESIEFAKRAEVLKESLRTHLWDEEKQLFADAFIDGKRSNQFSEHANAMVLAEHIATVEQAEKVCHQLLIKDNNNFIKRENGMTMVSPAMSYFLHKGLANYGFVNASLKVLNNRFSHMLESDTNGTLWEEWWLDGSGRTGKFQGGRTRSDAQTESVFSPALFAEFVLGIRVNRPGMEELIISKPNTVLTHIAASIPTPLGNFKIKWSLTKDNSLMMTIPENMYVKLDLDSLTGLQKEIFINDKSIKFKTNINGFHMLNSGTYKISF